MSLRAEIVAEDPPGWLRISGELSPEETARFMVLWARGATDDGATPAEAVDALIRAEDWSVFGGLRLSDLDTGARVDPGCCLLLEDWRSWVGVDRGAYPDLGHDGPWADFDDEGLTVWPAGGEDHRDSFVREGLPVRVRRGQVPELLRSVQNDLIGLLGCLGRWAQENCPQHADALVTLADRVFAVRRPLD
ncbi:hypothetical protein [Kribbella swartbergensis]